VFARLNTALFGAEVSHILRPMLSQESHIFEGSPVGSACEILRFSVMENE